MEKKKFLIVVAILVGGLFLFSSCYTNKKGIVPCPQGFNDTQIENVDVIPTEKV